MWRWQGHKVHSKDLRSPADSDASNGGGYTKVAAYCTSVLSYWRGEVSFDFVWGVPWGHPRCSASTEATFTARATSCAHYLVLKISLINCCSMWEQQKPDTRDSPRQIYRIWEGKPDHRALLSGEKKVGSFRPKRLNVLAVFGYTAETMRCTRFALRFPQTHDTAPKSRPFWTASAVILNSRVSVRSWSSAILYPNFWPSCKFNTFVEVARKPMKVQKSLEGAILFEHVDNSQNTNPHRESVVSFHISAKTEPQSMKLFALIWWKPSESCFVSCRFWNF
jgi:hypothetical protein